MAFYSPPATREAHPMSDVIDSQTTWTAADLVGVQPRFRTVRPSALQLINHFQENRFDIGINGQPIRWLSATYGQKCQ